MATPTPQPAWNHSTNAVADSPPLSLGVPYTVCEVVVATIAIVGNVLVCVVFVTDRRLRKRTNYYILSLSLADLLVGVLGIPVAILASIGLPRQLEACLFNISILIVLCTVSIFSLLAVSLDRYWAIMYPLQYGRLMTGQVAIAIVVGCWLLGAIIGLLPVMGWSADPYPFCLFTRVMDYDYLVFLYFTTIILPGVLMAGFYVKIYIIVVKQVRTMSLLSSQHHPVRKRNRSIYRRNISGKEIRAAKNLSIIVLFFMMCWFPLYTINCVNAFCPDCEIPMTLTNFAIVLSHANSALNPLLYAYSLRDFRHSLYTLLCVRILRLDSLHENPTWFRARLMAEQEALRQIQRQEQHRIRPRTISAPPYRRNQLCLRGLNRSATPSPSHQLDTNCIRVDVASMLTFTPGNDASPEARSKGTEASIHEVPERQLQELSRRHSCGHLLQVSETKWNHQLSEFSRKNFESMHRCESSRVKLETKQVVDEVNGVDGRFLARVIVKKISTPTSISGIIRYSRKNTPKVKHNVQLRHPSV